MKYNFDFCNEILIEVIHHLEQKNAEKMFLLLLLQ